MSYFSPLFQRPNVSLIYNNNFNSWSSSSFHPRVYYSDIVSSANIAVFGFSAMANSIVILVFFKDGFRSTSNISFFALAIADLLVSILWTVNQVNSHTKLLRMNDPIRRFWEDKLFPCAEAINTIASWITAIITWERLCCIAFPLKVKRIFTRKLIFCLIQGGFLYEVAAMTLYFVGEHIRNKGTEEMRNSPRYFKDGRFYINITGLETQALGYSIFNNARLARSYIPNYVLYTAIVVGTVLLVAKFTQTIQVKKSLTGGQGPEKMSNKEKKLIKSVIAVCVIYITTCTPLNVYDTLWYTNIIDHIFLLDRCLYLVRGLNHALNIFVYIAVNSNFRKEFKSMFCFCCIDKGPMLKK
ncbi:peptide receptor GPCR [Elysia marginata]|uniref:Peptide receptor GPCR n=1 Tax=Elysia marginata TaxID=1093978 RepID=A0AAV4J3W0_9GAST|nr:peptide receptor GPCR [Elysia marginata]